MKKEEFRTEEEYLKYMCELECLRYQNLCHTAFNEDVSDSQRELALASLNGFGDNGTIQW